MSTLPNDWFGAGLRRENTAKISSAFHHLLEGAASARVWSTTVTIMRVRWSLLFCCLELVSGSVPYCQLYRAMCRSLGPSGDWRAGQGVPEDWSAGTVQVGQG